MAQRHAKSDTGATPGSGPASHGDGSSPTGEPSASRRDETVARILNAAAELFTRRDPAKVTVREIAEKAGVTHPLVHQYIGSKADILEAVIEDGAPRRQQMIVEHPDVREVIPLLAADVSTRRVHSKAIVRAAMDGVGGSILEDRMKTGSMLMDLANEEIARGAARGPVAGAMDPRAVLAAVTALMFGWVAIEPWILEMYGLDDEAEARAWMADICAQVTELMFPPEGAPSAGGQTDA